MSVSYSRRELLRNGAILAGGLLLAGCGAERHRAGAPPALPATTPSDVPVPTPTPIPSPSPLPDEVRLSVPLPSWLKSGPSDRPLVALTMDDFWDRYGVDSLEKLLDIGQQRDVRFTFFPTGAALDSHIALGRQAVWQRAVAEGHEIGNHTYSHPSLSKLSRAAIDDQLTRQQDAVNRTLGRVYKTRLMRPPGGDGGFSPGTAVDAAINAAGYSVAIWDIGGDNASAGADFADALLNPKRKPLHNGAIILTHPTTLPVEYFPWVIDGFREMGFEPTTITGLFNRSTSK